MMETRDPQQKNALTGAPLHPGGGPKASATAPTPAPAPARVSVLPSIFGAAHAPLPSDADGQQAATPADDPLLQCIELVCTLHGRPVSAKALDTGVARRPDGRVDPAQLPDLVKAHGLSAGFAQRALRTLPDFTLPVVLLMRDGSARVLTSLNKPTEPASAGSARVLSEKTLGAGILLPESGLAEHTIDLAQLEADYSGTLLYVKPRPAMDRRGDFQVEVSPSRWFWQILGRYKSYYLHVALATVVVNVLALGGSLFTMVVYDRVVPNQAYSTLWVLAIGVGIAAVFEFGARMLRAWLTDVAGKKADIVMSSLLFRRVLGLRLDQQPGSAGSFANTLREFESVRDFVTSATLLAMADAPFVLLFVGVIALLAGPLAWVPVVAMVVVLLATALAQIPLARLMQQYMQGMSRKQSIAVEAIEGLEALKANRAEAMMQSRWEHSNGEMATFSAKSRFINAWVLNTVNIAQQLATVVVVVWGVYNIHDNLLTMGGLIAATMLTGRAIAPVNQVAALGLRWQQARSSLKSLNELMGRAQDREAGRDYVAAPSLSGAIALQGVSHRYGAGQGAKPSLEKINLSLKAGERVAVLGRVGSGKSTLLRVAAGLLPPSEGMVALDGLDVRQIEPADVRARVAYLAQEPALFYGTLKDNILLGTSHVQAARLSAALRMTGLDRVVASHPRGLDMPIGEHGIGLSGGQRQLVALARLFVRDPALVLLDEPTSAMDMGTEQQIMAAMGLYLKGRTMVMVTHRMQWVALADRVVVVDAGQIVANGPREQVLQQLSKGLVAAPKS
jgi:ATP-binding cassette, subfamily C, bacterial LapB